ncbi:MAG TPA: FAD:protein FMN transferase [Gaiellaceae bacterium]|nr:FAD:protein FMN transferase [Gaiellaceae bacterium]
MIERRGFRAMGTDIELIVEAGDAGPQLTAAEQEFDRLEALLSRFRDDSELSRLNRDGSIDAGPDLQRLVALALEARERTGGRFDPTVHDALVGAGYDRSFEDVPGDSAEPPRAARCGGDVRIDGGRIVLGDGVHLDLGGIGKGYAAERAAELLGIAGPCLVNAGGDIATRGGAWPVGVETADGTMTLELHAGGLATSGRDRRRWRKNGREQHHIIDPSTGEPAETDLLRVTVIARDAVEAEVEAKVIFLSGSRAAAHTELSTILVTDDGRTLLTGALA